MYSEMSNLILNSDNMEVVDSRKILLQQQHHFHVLAVDDSLTDRKLLERLLIAGSSCKVTCVDSGDKALKYLGLIDEQVLQNNNNSTTNSLLESSSPPQPLQLQEGSKVNLIMTDYCMPGMNGYDLLKRLKGSSCKDVPVVIMSSENVPSIVSMCLEEGAEEFLIKPLQLSDLQKLQPYFVKSVENSCDEQESANSSTDSDNDDLMSISMNNNDNSTNSNSISKRKAMSTEPPERSRPKMKGLAVV
ncbi:two-component response regulator ARR17-like [Cicer arietinum]|uniref:Two-component response regulator ARR17-like n=1 Tax=Cicer arietinum TaxID=3827 RepID=A0A1S2YBR9_CICAR|nr:two-component response regulator ARR17-like [Cicer arietinum]